MHCYNEIQILTELGPQTNTPFLTNLKELALRPKPAKLRIVKKLKMDARLSES